MWFARSASSWLLMILTLVSVVPAARGAHPDEATAEKVNLALRRTADRLLRVSGDSTSRIPAIEHAGSRVWRVYLHRPFLYDSLPHILQASLDRHRIRQAYEVTVRRCNDAVIDLGYHQQDLLADGAAPCEGREAPEGCHYIEVVFAAGGERKPVGGSGSLALLLAVFILAGAWWWYRKKAAFAPATPDHDMEAWLSFGHSRLHATEQVLICGDVRHSLTYREAKLLRLFAAHPGQLLERDFILRHVWGDEGVQVGRSVDMFVSRLRKKLKADRAVGIVAVHGVGYKLETGIEQP